MNREELIAAFRLVAKCNAVTAWLYLEAEEGGLDDALESFRVDQTWKRIMRDRNVRIVRATKFAAARQVQA